MTKCLKCGEELVISKIGKDKYCRNEKCKGWFCFYCDKWHAYGTYCGNGDILSYNVRDQRSYDKWCKNHEEDIFRMLKDSGCDMMQEGMQNEQ